jgi:hypothetical protein
MEVDCQHVHGETRFSYFFYETVPGKIPVPVVSSRQKNEKTGALCHWVDRILKGINRDFSKGVTSLK